MFKSGFTLIETIVVISVILILIGLSYAGYASFTQRQKLISAGQNLKNSLRDVQSRSFNGEADCSVCNCTNPSGNILSEWFVDLTQRQFYGNCNGTDYTVTSLRMESDLIIDTDNFLIEFINDPPRVKTDSTICLSLNGLPGWFYRIDISTSGDISDSEGLTPECII